MPSITHRVISTILLLAAVGAWKVNQLHMESHHPEVLAENKVWYLKHRGYPSQFGYLSHYWGLRVVESEIESEIREKGEATIAMRLKLFDADGLMGYVTLQFDANLQINGTQSLKLDVDKRTAAIIDYSDGFDLATFQPYLTDLLHDMYHGSRSIISLSPNEAIIDIPYMGIVRLHSIDEARIIETDIKG